jgi:hypothetical protein
MNKLIFNESPYEGLIAAGDYCICPKSSRINLCPEKSRFLQRDADAKATYRGLIPALGDLLHLDIEAESNLYPEKSNFHRDDADC